MYLKICPMFANSSVTDFLYLFINGPTEIQPRRVRQCCKKNIEMKEIEANER